MPSWKRLDRRTRVPQGEPSVGIHKRGNLALNRAAVEALGSPGAVEVLYDEDARLIGLKAAKPSASTYPIQTKGSVYLVAGKALVRTMKIDTSRAMRYPATMIDGVLTVDLSKGIPRGAGRPWSDYLKDDEDEV
jgi:hypothetical protein